MLRFESRLQCGRQRPLCRNGSWCVAGCVVSVCCSMCGRVEETGSLNLDFNIVTHFLSCFLPINYNTVTANVFLITVFHQ